MDEDRERERQAALESYCIVGTEAEDFYNRVVALAAASCDCPIALITFIDKDRQWFKAVLGLDLQETPRELSFCAHAVDEDGQMLVVEDAHADPRFIDNGLVVGAPNIRFYAGAVFFASNGVPLGTVCVIDRKPRQLASAQRNALIMLAREVEHQLKLRRSLAEAERASDHKSKLAAMLAHDLRNPLQVAMLRAGELSVRLPHGAETRNALADLEWALQNLQRMTVDMLDVCAAEAGHLRVRRSHIDVRVLASEIEVFARSAAGSGQRVRILTELERPVVDTDRDLVRRIADNLLSNALKYSPSNGDVTLQLTSRADGALSIRVTDQGPGIPEGDRESIFNSYVRLDREGDRHARSSYGLGLTFCRLAASALQGRVWAESRPQGGAMFCVDLPPVPCTNAASARGQERSLPALKPSA